MSIETDVESKIISIMKASADFNSIRLFIKGVAVNVPVQHYPYCEVDVLGASNTARYTGVKRTRQFNGEIRFFGRYQDNLSIIADREADVPSYSQVKAFISDTEQLFEQVVNRTLQSLNGDGWTVQEFVTDTVEYGFQDKEQRGGIVWDNWGLLRFQCIVQRSV